MRARSDVHIFRPDREVPIFHLIHVDLRNRSEPTELLGIRRVRTSAQTVCGRELYFWQYLRRPIGAPHDPNFDPEYKSGDPRGIQIPRKHAEKFARICKTCGTTEYHDWLDQQDES